jgi:excisionase family DNA binding protein
MHKPSVSAAGTIGTDESREPTRPLEKSINGSLEALLKTISEDIASRVVARLVAERPNQRLFSVKQAAEYMGRTEYAVRNMIARRALPSVRQDGRVFVDREDLDHLIRLNKF